MNILTRTIFRDQSIASLNNNAENKNFTIQYTKDELDKITLDFVSQMNEYIARVNNCILKTIEDIVEQEVEPFPPNTILVEEEQRKEEVNER